MQGAATAPPLLRRADQLPEWPPAARVKETPAIPAVFQPDVSISKPELPTTFGRTTTLALALEESPAVSVTTTLTA